jgi:hypothetical protein
MSGVVLFGVRQETPDAEPGKAGARGADAGPRETRIGGAPVCGLHWCFFFFFFFIFGFRMLLKKNKKK